MNNKIEIALFEPQIPQNMGTILRTADCFGITVNIILPCGFIFGGKEMKRAGMDYLSTVSYKLYDSFDDFRIKQQQNNKQIILVTTKASTPYYDYKYKNNEVLLFGNESSGVPDYVRKTVDSSVTIPMVEGKRSLNLAVSCAIVLSRALFG